MTRRSTDAVALIFGLLLTTIALGTLWLTLVGPIDWHLVGLVAPIGLIAAGIAGLALSRPRP